MNPSDQTLSEALEVQKKCLNFQRRIGVNWYVDIMNNWAESQKPDKASQSSFFIKKFYWIIEYIKKLLSQKLTFLYFCINTSINTTLENRWQRLNQGFTTYLYHITEITSCPCPTLTFFLRMSLLSNLIEVTPAAEL